MFNRLLADLLPVASKMQLLSADSAINTKTETDGTDRLLCRATGRAGNAGDGKRNGGPRRLGSATGHLGYRLLADGAIL